MSTILRPYVITDAEWVVSQHAALYARHEGFDGSFGPVVAGILQDFDPDRHPTQARGWIAEATLDGKEQRVGSIFVMRDSDDWARLRLFLVAPESRGTGLAQRMIETAIDFARHAGYRNMRLWTHESHVAAGRLYARNGFQVIDSVARQSFGQAVVAQTWARVL